MEKQALQQLLERYKSGQISQSEMITILQTEPIANVGDYAKLDLERPARNGFPEVIFGQGKTPDQVAAIFKKLMENGPVVMATRVTPETAAFVQSQIADLQYDTRSRILFHDRNPERTRLPGIAVVTAGTSDVPVAEEAAVTAEIMGNQVDRVYDVGVAGLHRLLSHLPTLQKARTVIVVAGMEGALVSVVGGLIACPIIAVPTSVGYGASFNGLAALLAMLNSCASGVSVVNIDNGFGAAVVASRINHLSGNQS